MSTGRHLAFPFRIGSDGRTATPQTLDDHVRGEIIQLLLTAPGERPFLPSFGAGLKRLVFEKNDPITAALAKATVAQSLSRWLQQRIAVEALDVRADDATLTVDLRYRLLATGEVRSISLRQQPGNRP
jgi:phage baseplate assembly protein W